MSHAPDTAGRPPLSRGAVVDAYFIENRGKVLDLAAFLDRVDRAAPATGAPGEDFRLAALRRALGILSDGQPERARRILELWSDPTSEPIAAAGGKGAAGAWTGGIGGGVKP